MGREPFDCAEAEKFVHVFLDGEFSEADREAFERHLEVCERCRRMVAFERQFKAALRTDLAPPPLPAGFEERLWEALDREDERQTARRGRRSWVSSAAVAAAVATVVSAAVVLSVVGTGRKQPAGSGSRSAPTTRGAGSHAAPAVPRPLSRPLPVRVLSAAPAPQVPSAGIVPAAATTGAHGVVSVDLVDPDVLAEEGFVSRWIAGRQVYFGMRNGKNVAVFVHDDGRVYAVSADLPEEELADIVRTLLEDR